MFDRKELLKSKEYYLANIQNDLFTLLRDYMEENGLNKTQLANELGVSKDFISQILNGNFDHRISMLVELSLAIGKVPKICFEDVEQLVEDDAT